jgi:hypothetical protein
LVPEITYPIAKVLQSAAGANAVMGSKIVLAEMCSDVDGSKRMTLPWAFPYHVLVGGVAGATTVSGLTKCNIAVPHPRSHPNLLIGRKASHFVSREKVPYNCRGPCIVAHY